VTSLLSGFCAARGACRPARRFLPWSRARSGLAFGGKRGAGEGI
jgi:hypothetical protein